MAFSIEIALGYLARAREHGRLGHAYLVSGPVLESCEQLAAKIIALVNGVEPAGGLDGMESELVRFVRPVSKSRRIKVSQMRELERSLHLAAPAGKTKVGVILEADRMGREASNAFLKTLEEPPAGTLLLLLSTQAQQLLETILSRCVRIELQSPPGPARRTEAEQALLAVVPDFVAASADGGGGVAGVLGFAGVFAGLLKSMKAEIASGHERGLKEEAEIYKQRTEGDWLDKREDHYKALTESEYVGRRNGLVEMLLLVFGDALRSKRGDTRLDLPELEETSRALARRFAVEELLRRYDAVDELRATLETSVNEKLAMENAFLAAFG